MKTLLIDLDGITHKWMHKVFEIYGYEFPDPWPLGCQTSSEVLKKYGMDLPEDDHWIRIKEYGDFEFWTELEIYDHTHELLSIADQFDDWYFCTKACRSPWSSYAKHQWANRLLGKNQNKIYICRGPKSQLANPETVLLDDNEYNCNEFFKSGGKALCLDQPWNDSALSIENVFDVLRAMSNG